MEPITSHGNARLKHARKLQARRHRRAMGQFLAEGEDIVEEALPAGVRRARLAALERADPRLDDAHAEWPPHARKHRSFARSAGEDRCEARGSGARTVPGEPRQTEQRGAEAGPAE